MTFRTVVTPRTLAGPPSLAPDAELLASPVGLAIVVGSIAFVIAGLAWPQAADALLRLLLTTLGIGFVGVRVYRAVQPVRSAEKVYSPFDGLTAGRTPTVAPREVLRRAAELKAADDEHVAQRTTIPPSALLTVRKEAQCRLAEHHGLDVLEPSHHPQIRSLVSASMWGIIRPHESEIHPSSRPMSRRTSVPLSQLGRILDDLERL
jgi:hypothetical protein